jgi:hypothetical protein
LSCGDDDKKISEPTPSPYRPQSSIENVLYNLRESYIRRDLEAYRVLFAPDFVFRFNPFDVYNPGFPVPSSWGISEECRAADSLFASKQVTNIAISWSFPDAAVDSAATGTWILQATGVDVLVVTTCEDGTHFSYLAEDGREMFHLRTYPQERASDGNSLWRITRWTDEDPLWPARAGSATKTWGLIKYAFSR